MLTDKLKCTELYSFDIFDTLVTRRTATPTGIFAIMQNALKNENFSFLFKQNFYKIRIGSEDLARQRNRLLKESLEVTLDDIYDIIQINENLSNDDIKFLKSLEIETETQNIVLLRDNFAILKSLYDKGKRVILISDMYLTTEQIHYIIDDLDPIFKNLQIYVSCEYGVSKHSGELYKVVKEKENFAGKNWIHYGDNQFSDIRNAKMIGINAQFLKAENLMPYEQYLLNHTISNSDYQFSVGASRISRIENKFTFPTKKYFSFINSALKGDDETFEWRKEQLNSAKRKFHKNKMKYANKYDFGASFAGPIIYNYVRWVLFQAQKRGFKNLYFIARDGYIPKIIADLIIKQEKYDIKAHYIYGSRKAWRVVNEKTYEFAIERFFEEYHEFFTPKFLSYRFNIDVNTILSFMNLKNADKKLRENEIKYYEQIFLTDKNIKKTIIEKSQERVELLKDYFRQEIDFTEKDIAFVDINGSGYTQDFVAEILNEISPCTVWTFYYVNERMAQKDNSKKLCYFPTCRWDVFLELLCRSCDGQTIGYKRTSMDEIIPVIEDSNSQAMKKWGIEDYMQGICDYTRNILTTEKINEYESNMYEVYCNYSNYYYSALDINSAEIMGSIPYKTIGNESNILECAPKFKILEILKNFLLFKPINIYNNCFNNISYIRSGQKTQKILAFCNKYKNPQKLLFNIYIHKRNKQAYIRIFGIKISFKRLMFCWYR
ncbi:hypothetical protein J6S88_05810 [bacterium]|nr:hypothetical protein [bacterium]